MKYWMMEQKCKNNKEGRARKKIAASGDLLDYLNLSVDRKTVQR